MKKVSKKQLTEFSKAIKDWKVDKSYKNDKEMIELYKKDRKDLRKILALLKKEDYAGVGLEMYDLDTAVRDQIPEDIYNFVMDWENIELKKTGVTMNKVVIYVSGGVVQEVRAEQKDIEVVLFDVDNLEAEGKTVEQVSRKWKTLTKGMISVF